MKRAIALLLALVMVFSLCACGDKEEIATPAPEQHTDVAVWSAMQSVDEFGDVTDESDSLLGATITGTFSNTATSKSNLNVTVFFRRNPSLPHYVLELKLLEYVDTPVTFYDGDQIILKTKSDGAVNESSLIGQAPNGNLFAGLSEGDYIGDVYFNDLYNGNDIQCIIYIGSSQYNFTIPSDNFKFECEQLGFEYASGGMQVNEALNKFLSGSWGYDLSEAIECLELVREHLTLVNSDKLKTLFTSGDLYLCISSPYAHWTQELYDNSDIVQKAYFTYEKEWGGFTVEVTKNYIRIKIDDSYPDGYIVNPNNTVSAYGDTFEYRYLYDGILIEYKIVDGQYTLSNVCFKTIELISSESMLYDQIEKIQSMF